MSALVTAITAYDADYSRFPVSPQAQAAASAAGGDFTYGGTITSAGGATSTVQNPASYGSYQLVNNAEVIAILMDNTQNPVDANHQKNPKQVHYLNATPAANIASPGVGPDGVYRDPWGNPYIITMDLNYDEMCVDAFYGLNNVSSGGLNGLVRDPNVAGNDNWAFRGKVMVWSAGVDGQINATIPANQGVNKDNVLSWQ